MSVFVDVNGSLLPEEKAVISIFDRGFLLGDGCFEVLKVSSGRFIHLEDHLERLLLGAKYLKISTLGIRELLLKRMERLLSHSGFSTAYFRIALTRGNGLGFSSGENLKPNLYLFIKEIKEDRFSSELKLKLVEKEFCSEGFHIKTNMYQETLAKLLPAKEEGYGDILWINKKGELTEASASNIFFMKRLENGSFSFVTPHLDAGLLAGITRKNFICYLKREGKLISQEKITINDLRSQSYGFLSSSIKGLVGIAGIGSFSFSCKKSQNEFEKLRFGFYNEGQVLTDHCY